MSLRNQFGTNLLVVTPNSVGQFRCQCIRLDVTSHPGVGTLSVEGKASGRGNGYNEGHCTIRAILVLN